MVVRKKGTSLYTKKVQKALQCGDDAANKTSNGVVVSFEFLLENLPCFSRYKNIRYQ